MSEVPSRHRTGTADAVEVQPRDEISGSYVDTSQPLIWRRSVPLAPDFELRQGEAVFGEMEPALMDGTDATGECLGHALDLRAESSLLGGVRVDSRRPREGREGPSFRGLLFGWGRIETSQGEALRWRHSFSRLYDHLLIDSRGDELLRLRPAFLRFARTETRVILTSSGWARSDLPELLLLTWFLRAHAEARGRRIFKGSRKQFDGPGR